MQIYTPLLVALIGALVYGLSNSPNFAELGRLMFAVGLLVFLLHGAPGLSLR